LKIPIQNIYYLLSYAWNKLEESEKLEIDISDYEDSLNLLSRILISGTNRLLKKGLDKSYITVNERYPGIKGKINFKDSLRQNSFRQGYAICEFDKFSPNVIQNKILKSMLAILSRMEGLDKNLKASSRESYFRFVDVDEIEIRLHHFSKVKIHRNNFEYDFLLKICKLILECAVLNENTGKYEFIDFVRNEKAMAYLFEDFVRNFYNQEQSEFKVKREDIKWDAIAVGNSNLALLPKMQTDISLISSDRKIVMDTKFYKQTLSFNFSEKFHSANLYQIYSYINNLESNETDEKNKFCEGVLLYPTVQKEIDESYQMGNHQIRIATVNLNQNWNLIHDRLLNILNLLNCKNIYVGGKRNECGMGYLTDIFTI